MIKNLPNYYHLAAITPMSEQTLERRSIAINSIVKNKDMPWLFDCVRLYMDKSIKNIEFDSDFVKEFHNEDPMFLANSIIEKRILAGAILAECITSRPKNAIEIAMVIKTAAFGVDISSLAIPEILNTADEYLSNVAVALRTPTQENATPIKLPIINSGAQTVASLTTYVKGLAAYIKETAATAKKSQNLLNDKIVVLEEESNIHWWLFRSYCGLVDKSVKELSIADASVLIAQELTNMLQIIPGPPNMKEYLRKILSEILSQNDFTLTIKEVVNLMSSDLIAILNEKSTKT